MIDEASETNVPFIALLFPNSFANGFSGFKGLIHFSFPPKKEETSITTFLPFLATILNALSTGFIKFLSNAEAIGSAFATTLSVCTLCIYTLFPSLLKRMSKGRVTICPATKS